MKRVALLLLSVLLIQVAYSQYPCLPEGITFTTQIEIDSFQVNYPYCSEIEGDVIVTGSDITNLHGLYVIDEIGGDLIIGGDYGYGTSVTDMYGLWYLTSIGGKFVVSNNLLLTSLEGFHHLDGGTIDSISIFNNPLLSTCDIQAVCDFISLSISKPNIDNNGPDCTNLDEVIVDCANNCLHEGKNFSNQSSIDNFKNGYPGCTEILGYVTIEGDNITNLQGLDTITEMRKRVLIGSLTPDNSNPNLLNLEGLQSLKRIGWWLGIQWNKSLTSLSGLDSLEEIGDELYITRNDDLINLDGLNNLKTIGNYCSIRNNNSLNDLEGFQSLKSIGSWIQLEDNESLTTLDGLSPNDTLTVNGSLYIQSNTSLADINALQNVRLDSLKGLYLSGNSTLSECDIQILCEFLSDPVGNVVIQDNGNGCSSQEEIMFKCHACIPEGITFTSQTQIDSFQYYYPDCVYLEGDLSINGPDIKNLDSLHIILAINGDLSIFGNDSLTNLKGLSNIDPETITNLYILNNPMLSSCEIQNICDFLFVVPTWYVDISNNESGCNSVEEVEDACVSCMAGGVTFNTQAQIDSFNILYPDCEIIQGDVFISGGDISDLVGLNHLKAIMGNLSIKDNDQLKDLWGLDNLHHIGGALRISDNDSLSNLVLYDLNSIDGLLSIEMNDKLETLAFLGNIQPGTITGLTIANNPNLSTCHVQSICSYLAAPIGVVKIHDNDINCNSQEEILQVCYSNVVKSTNYSFLSVQPNPSSNGSITISLDNPNNLHLSCFNTFGQQVHTQELHTAESVINVSTWTPGIYLAVVYEEGKPVGRAKFIVQ